MSNLHLLMSRILMGSNLSVPVSVEFQVEEEDSTCTAATAANDLFIIIVSIIDGSKQKVSFQNYEPLQKFGS